MNSKARCALAVLTLFGAALGSGVAWGAPDRIVSPVDNSRSVVIAGTRSSLAQPGFDQGLAAPETELSYATLLLKPAPGLATFLASQNTIGSPNYRKWLTPEEFADRFGASQNDVAKLSAWLVSQGLQVHDVARGRHWITFSGTAGQMGKALHTEFHRYAVNGEMHVANATDPSVPEAFAGVVAGFRGLNDFLPKPPARTVSPQYSGGGFNYLAPGDLATIYDINPLYNQGINGAGVTMVVVGESDILLSDIAGFRADWFLPVNNPKLHLFGPDPGKVPGAEGEADLDLEWAGSIAPGASVIYAFAADVYTALQYAVDQNLGQVLSLSYSRCELDQSTAFEAVAQQANAQGMTLVISAGDAGAAQCDRGNVTPQVSTGYSASWPATFPEVTAVGGTEFAEGSGHYWSSRNALNGDSAQSYIPETVWNDSAALNALAAGGGGPSAIFPKPAWQVGPGVPNDGARDLPDISLSGSWFHDPYVMESEGLFLINGGTSASAQVFAGMVALLNQYLVTNGTLSGPGLGNINPALYRMAQAGSAAFHDITSGNNMLPCVQGTPDCVDGRLGFSAGPGYDLATGLGSVDLFQLASTWNSGSPSSTSLTAAPATTTPSGTVQLTAAVSGTGTGIPTGSVSFNLEGVTGLNTAEVAPVTSAGEIPLGYAALNGKGVATISVSGSLLSLGNGTVRAVYSGDGVFDGSAASTSVTVNYSSSTGSIVVPLITPNPVIESGEGLWPYTVALVEKGGVATTLTGFTIDGVKQSLQAWPSTSLPANGTIYASLLGEDLVAPINQTFAFTGSDAGGRTWTQQVTIPFLAGPSTDPGPGITLTTATPVVNQDTSASSCQWAEPVTVQETGGFLTLLGVPPLTSMTVNGTSLTAPQIQQVFGTTRLAPFGSLQGALCFSNPAPSKVQVSALSDSGGLLAIVQASTSATLGTPSGSPPAFTSPQPGSSVSLAAESNGSVPPASIPVSFSAGSPPWTVSVAPNNKASSWLTVSPLSGTGAGTINISASAAGLSPGAYTAFLTIASAAAQPQTVEVVVTLTVGGSSDISIAGLVNNFSGGLMAAPGMIAAVFGAGMAPQGTSVSAPFLPLPLSLAGVSATVNGVSAPLYYVSPGQVNIQIPYETGAGPAVLAINNNGQVATFLFTVAVTAPGLFPSAIDNATGQLVSTVTAGQVLLLYVTGEGDLTPTFPTGATPPPETNTSLYPQPRQPLSVTIGGVPVTPLFAGIPNGLTGTTQIDLTVPSGLSAGAQQLVVSVGGVAAPAVSLTIAGSN